MKWQNLFPFSNFLYPLLFFAVFAGIALLGRILSLLRLRKSLRSRLQRIFPPLELLALAAFAFALVQALIADEDPVAMILPGIGLMLLVAAGWFAIRDYVSGIILKAEDVYERDDWIRAGTMEGRIIRTGSRTLEIETEDGDRVKLPYSRLARDFLVKSDHSDPAKAHTFRLQISRDIPVAEAIDSIRGAVLNSVWSSLKRNPQIEMAAESGESFIYEVTVYALDSRYFSQIEGAVRAKVLA